MPDFTEDRLRRVTNTYESAYPNPIVVTAGDELEITERETDWEGWLWCVDREGREGWIPDSFVTEDDGCWTARSDYTAAELSVTAGETVVSRAEVAGWEWCENASGSQGWVPSECLGDHS